MCVKFGHVITVSLISPRRSLALSLRNVMNLQFRLNLWGVKSTSSSPLQFSFKSLVQCGCFQASDNLSVIAAIKAKWMRDYLLLYACGVWTWRNGDPSLSNSIPLNLGYRKAQAGSSLPTIVFQPLTLYRGPTTWASDHCQRDIETHTPAPHAATVYTGLESAETTTDQFRLLPEEMLV